MAKNLKLKIKNTQLAEALNLKKLTKTGKAPKEAAPIEETVEAEPVEKVAPPQKPVEEVKPEPKVQEPVEEVVETPPPPPQKKMALPNKEDTSYPRERAPYTTPEKRFAPGYPRPQRETPPRGEYQQRGPRDYPPREGGYRPPQHSGPREGGYRPPQHSGPREGGYRPPAAGQGYRPGPGAPRGDGQQRPAYPRREPYPRQAGAPYTPRPAYPRQAPSFVPTPPDLEKGEKRIEKEHRKEPPKDFEAKKSGVKEYRDFKTVRKQESGVFDSRARQGLSDLDNEVWRKKRPSHKHKLIAEEIVSRPKNVKVKLPITIKDLAIEMKLKASELVSKLFMQGVILTLNDFLDDETTVQLLGHEFECEITIDTAEEKRIQITDQSIREEVSKTPPEQLKLRPCIVAFMGHVDHGKTSLIDAIRKTNLTAGEAGAITQHIGAFRCHTAVGDITVLDTPGHEAFSAMRARGADVTDLVVLVVAGDEGIKTQSLEAIEQATSAKVPIMVAINKCDKPGFDVETVYRQLSDNNLLPESWGGTVVTVKCSAVTKEGIKELLEMLALQAEILELKANPEARARGTVIESELHKGLGSVATVLVQNGTLKTGDALVFAQHWGRVKTMHDEHGKELNVAGPSTPVKITGLSGLPEAGSEFITVKNEKEARELAEARTEGKKHALGLLAKKASLENILQQKAESQAKKTLHLVLRADVQGSLEALKTSLMKIASKKVDINITSVGIGEISESDIQLAAASKATIIGFHTQVESHADDLIKQLKVVVRLHNIIYHAVDDVKELMRSMLDKIPQENDMGSAVVKAVFKSSQLGLIAGCQVVDGFIKRNHLVRVVRGNDVIWKGTINSLKRVKEDVREVQKGIECGILLNNFSDFKEGDIIQAYEITYLEQEI